MAIAQAIAAGQRSAEMWAPKAQKLVDPGQILTSITAAIAANRDPNPGTRRIVNLSPKKIHAAAASAAVAQEELEAKREQNRIAREKWEWEKENIRRQRVRQGEADERAWQQEWDRSMGAIGTRYDADIKRAREAKTEEQKDFRQQRQDDYYQMLNSLENRRPEGIISFFHKYGAPDQRIEDVMFANDVLPDGKPNPDAGQIMVKYAGEEKPELWQSKDQLVKGLIGWANPDVQAKIQEQSIKSREQTRKEKETALKEKEEARKGKKAEWEMRGGIDPKTMQKYRADGLEFYQKLVENQDIDPNEQPFEKWFPDYVKTITGGTGQAGIGEAAQEGAKAAPGAQAAPRETGLPSWAPQKPHPEARWSPKVDLKGMTDEQGNAQRGAWLMPNAQGQWVVAPNQIGKTKGYVTPEGRPAVRKKIKPSADERKMQTTTPEAPAEEERKAEPKPKAPPRTGTMSYQTKDESGRAVTVTKDEAGNIISAVPTRQAKTQQTVASPVKPRTEKAEATAAAPREGEPKAQAPEPEKKEQKVPSEGGAEKKVAKAETGGKGEGKASKKKKKKKKQGSR